MSYCHPMKGRSTTKTPAPKARKLLPRAPVAVVPVTISQLNCASIAGVDPRRFLELLGCHPELPRVRVGKLAIVDVEDWRTWVRCRAQHDAEGDAPAADADDGDVPTTAAGVLAKLGFELVP